MRVKKGAALEFYFRRLNVTRSPEIDQGSDQQVDFYFGRLMVRAIKESKRVAFAGWVQVKTMNFASMHDQLLAILVVDDKTQMIGLGTRDSRILQGTGNTKLVFDDRGFPQQNFGALNRTFVGSDLPRYQGRCGFFFGTDANDEVARRYAAFHVGNHDPYHMLSVRSKSLGDGSAIQVRVLFHQDFVLIPRVGIFAYVPVVRKNRQLDRFVYGRGQIAGLNTEPRNRRFAGCDRSYVDDNVNVLHRAQPSLRNRREVRISLIIRKSPSDRKEGIVKIPLSRRSGINQVIFACSPSLRSTVDYAEAVFGDVSSVRDPIRTRRREYVQANRIERRSGDFNSAESAVRGGCKIS